ncbi:hypothetical protein AK812_SmicGene17831 [Symbiodinium microadriaticum]|uniref:Uncharacterized protein n=1 Tax=Symbiodinium microadriaticum TaxID=2951 RepID=A0A1Q9DWV0_SYMMI|nr:hypothetical protein AK812_SmicGene17831 [Symbiodinium microadriaticum]
MLQRTFALPYLPDSATFEMKGLLEPECYLEKDRIKYGRERTSERVEDVWGQAIVACCSARLGSPKRPFELASCRKVELADLKHFKILCPLPLQASEGNRTLRPSKEEGPISEDIEAPNSGTSSILVTKVCGITLTANGLFKKGATYLNLKVIFNPGKSITSTGCGQGPALGEVHLLMALVSDRAYINGTGGRAKVDNVDTNSIDKIFNCPPGPQEFRPGASDLPENLRKTGVTPQDLGKEDEGGKSNSDSETAYSVCKVKNLAVMSRQQRIQKGVRSPGPHDSIPLLQHAEVKGFSNSGIIDREVVTGNRSGRQSHWDEEARRRPRKDLLAWRTRPGNIAMKDKEMLHNRNNDKLGPVLLGKDKEWNKLLRRLQAQTYTGVGQGYSAQEQAAQKE